MRLGNIFAGLLASLFFSCAVFADDAGKDNLTRDEEPVVISVADCPAFQGSDLDDILVYRWVSGTNAWEKVLFQIDEKNDTYFDPGDNKFNHNDEVVFNAVDAGDRACKSTTNFWLEESINPIRYEIKVVDTYSEFPDTAGGWFYVYKAEDTPLDTDLVIIEGIQDSLRINTDCYYEKFLYRNPFVMEDLAIKAGCGGDSTDILDRRKTRTCITVGGLPLCFDEEDLVISFGEEWLVDGNVRAIVHLEGELQEYDVTVVDIIFYRKYIETIIEMHFEKFPLACDSLRYSTDCNPEVEGMYHIDNGVALGIQSDIIDGVQPDPPFAVQPICSFNEVTHATAGTWYEIIDFENVLPGHPGKFNFYNDGGPDPSGSESGKYPGTWGEAGVKFRDIPNEQFNLVGKTFFSSSDLDELGAKGLIYNDYYYNPLIVAVFEQMSDSTGVPSCSGSYVFSAFKAVLKNGMGVVNWELEIEDDIRGVNLYRRMPGESAPGEKLNSGRLNAGSGVFYDREIRPGTAYIYTLEAIPYECSPFILGTTSLVQIPVAKEENLGTNYPNPFNPNTTIPFRVPGDISIQVSLKIFDIRGMLIRTLQEEILKPGFYCEVWDGRTDSGQAVGSGIYFCRYELAGQPISTKKMTLVK